VSEDDDIFHNFVFCVYVLLYCILCFYSTAAFSWRYKDSMTGLVGLNDTVKVSKQVAFIKPV